MIIGRKKSFNKREALCAGPLVPWQMIQTERPPPKVELVLAGADAGCYQVLTMKARHSMHGRTWATVTWSRGEESEALNFIASIEKDANQPRPRTV